MLGARRVLCPHSELYIIRCTDPGLEIRMSTQPCFIEPMLAVSWLPNVSDEYQQTIRGRGRQGLYTEKPGPT